MGQTWGVREGNRVVPDFCLRDCMDRELFPEIERLGREQ